MRHFWCALADCSALLIAASDEWLDFWAPCAVNNGNGSSWGNLHVCFTWRRLRVFVAVQQQQQAQMMNARQHMQHQNQHQQHIQGGAEWAAELAGRPAPPPGADGAQWVAQMDALARQQAAMGVGAPMAAQPNMPHQQQMRQLQHQQQMMMQMGMLAAPPPLSAGAMATVGQMQHDPKGKEPVANADLRDAVDEESWVDEFVRVDGTAEGAEAAGGGGDDDAIRQMSRALAQAPHLRNDERINGSQFMRFMERLSGGEQRIVGNEVVGEQGIVQCAPVSTRVAAH